MKVFSTELPEWTKREPAIFLAINVAFPFSVLLLAQIFREPVFRWVTALTVIALMLWANIHRIRRGQSMKRLYIAILILNVLSFPFGGGISFVTTIDVWILTIESIPYYLS